MKKSDVGCARHTDTVACGGKTAPMQTCAWADASQTRAREALSIEIVETVS